MKYKVNKKIGVNKRQATAKDVAKAKSAAIDIAFYIFFMVMIDKEGYGVKRLKRLWGWVNELSDSVRRGYVSIKDIKKTLEEDYGIVME